MLETSEAGVFGTMVRTNIPFDCNDVNYKKRKKVKYSNEKIKINFLKTRYNTPWSLPPQNETLTLNIYIEHTTSGK